MRIKIRAKIPLMKKKTYDTVFLPLRIWTYEKKVEEVTQLAGRFLQSLKRGELQQLVAAEWSVLGRGIHED